MTASIRLCFGPAFAPAGVSAPKGFHDSFLNGFHDNLGAVLAEFPTVAIERDSPGPGPGSGDTGVIVDADAWRRGDVDLYHLDYEVDERAAQGQVAVRIIDRDGDPDLSGTGWDTGQMLLRTVIEVLTRCQRWVGRRNAGSAHPGFDRVIELHRQLHDLKMPLVRADYNHALDVWQWMLRLSPHAGEAVQIAALFHDIERLVAEANRRIEHLADDYDRFKHAHARGGAAMTRKVLHLFGLAGPLRALVGHLIEKHEQPPGPEEQDPDLALLNDADGLSFFSLNSAGFLDYYGPEHTRRKILWTLARLGPSARARLLQVRLRPDVGRLVAQALDDAPPPPLTPIATPITTTIATPPRSPSAQAAAPISQEKQP